MGKRSRPTPGQGVPSAFERTDTAVLLDMLFAERMSNLAAHTRGVHAHLLTGLTVRRRGPKDYIAVARRFNDAEGETQVIFGTGTSFSEALVGLDRAIAKGKWKRDRYALF